MNKFGNTMGAILVILMFTVIIGAVLALEVFVLILLGFTYDSWQDFAIFLIGFGIIEFILGIVMQSIVEAKAQEHRAFHEFWGHLIISFTLIMIAVNVMDSIAIPIVGAIIYAVMTALLYVAVDVFEQKNPE